MKKLRDMTLKGSYTVEATVVISICMIMFGTAVLLSYELFQSSIEYVSYKPDSFDAVKVFRIKEGVVGIIHALKD